MIQKTVWKFTAFCIIWLWPSLVMADPFLDQVFDGNIAAERPQILISRGAVLAWISDPATFLPPNAQAYYARTARRLVILAPGTAVLVFPPRTAPDRLRRDHDRLADKDFLLAVTEDGFWGVFDASQKTLFIDEPELKAIVKEEAKLPGRDAVLGMSKSTALTVQPVPPATGTVGLTRGELFRIVSDDGSRSVINFEGDVPSFLSKRQSLARSTKTPSDVPANYVIPDDGSLFRPIRISGGLIPSGDLDDWQAGKGNYRHIFEGGFADLRIPGSRFVNTDCGAKVTQSSEQGDSVDLDAKVSVDVSGGWLTFVTGKLGLGAEATKKLTNSLKTSSETIATISKHIFPVTYKDSAGNDSFWVGTATTCKAAPNLRTIAVFGSETGYLHSEFTQLDSDGHPPAPPQQFVNPTQPQLDQIPGGSPFDRNTGAVTLKCLEQELDLEELAAATMNNVPPYQVRAAIALASGRQAATTNLVRFYSDSGCKVPDAVKK